MFSCKPAVVEFTKRLKREIGSPKVFSPNHAPKIPPIRPAIIEYMQAEARYWSTDMGIWEWRIFTFKLLKVFFIFIKEVPKNSVRQFIHSSISHTPPLKQSYPVSYSAVCRFL